MPYLGWKIFACHLNEDTDRETKRSLIDWIRKRFSEDDWLIEDDDGGLTISQVENGFEIMVKVEANSFQIDYTIRLGERQQETETYVVAMESECLAWQGKIELKHKKLMEQVMRRLPWKWQKVGCYVEQGLVLKLVTSSNIEPGFEPFQIAVTTWDKLPIPDEPPIRVVLARPRVVKHALKRPKQRRKLNSLKALIREVDKDKHVPPLDRKRGVP